MPEGNERLAKLEARVDSIEHDFDKHADDCGQFRRDMRSSIATMNDVIGGVKNTLAKNYWIGIVAMAGVVALVQIVIERLLK